MNVDAEPSAVGSEMKRPLLSPNTQTHPVIVCAALLVAGVVMPWLVPGISPWWVAGAVVIGSHVGLVLVAAGAMARWIERRFGRQMRSAEN